MDLEIKKQYMDAIIGTYTTTAQSIVINPKIESLRLAKNPNGNITLQFLCNNEWNDVPIVELNDEGKVIG